jgi:hypothetical protein
MLEREFSKLFSKTCRLTKFSSQWLLYTSVRNPGFNNDFLVFQLRTRSSKKGKCLNQNKGFKYSLSTYPKNIMAYAHITVYNP